MLFRILELILEFSRFDSISHVKARPPSRGSHVPDDPPATAVKRLRKLDAVGSTPKGHPPNPPSLSLGAEKDH